MPFPELASHNTPLAPSVEKAYYRKCIELKRRLNEVEAANDEMKVKRVRLDRAVMKMRLERAFLLEQLERRMQGNVEASEGSGDEGMATPPPDRPHRDKRRRANPASGSQGIVPTLPSQHSSSVHQNIQPAPSYPASAAAPSAAYTPNAGSPPAAHHTPQPGPAQPLPTLPHSSPYGPPPPQATLPSQPISAQQSTNGVGREGARAEDVPLTEGTRRDAGATGEAVSAGPVIREDANGDRRIVSDANPDDGQAGFTAVNR